MRYAKLKSVKPRNFDTTDEKDIPADVKKRKKVGYVFFALCALSFLFSFYRLPFSLLSGFFALGACVWGVRYFIACIKTKGQVAFIALSVIGVFASVMSVFATAGTLIMYPVQKSYEECVTSAITQEAAISCQTEYKKGVSDLFEKLTGQPLPQ